MRNPHTLTQREKNLLKKSLGKLVRDQRKRLNFSQEELGYVANIHRTYIGGIERGERNVSIEILGVLACALKCELKDLMPKVSDFKKQ